MFYLSNDKENSRESLSESAVLGFKFDAGAHHEGPTPIVMVISDLTVERECLVKALEFGKPRFHALACDSSSAYGMEARPEVILVGVDSIDNGERNVRDIIGSIQTTLPDVPIVVLAENAETTTETASLFELGVSGCLSYSDGIEGLSQVLSLVIHGGACFPRECICPNRQAAQTVAVKTPHRILETTPQPAQPRPFPDVGLTAREHDVVCQLRKGKPNKIIAYELGISISTVKVHVRNIMRKTGATNRVEAALLQDIRSGGATDNHGFR